MFENNIENIKEQIISSTCELIKIPSVNLESTDSSIPFGKPCNDALEYVLNLAKSLGFRTKNVDGYSGYVEFGEGEELMGIIGHLDVVPANGNWTYPPFMATIIDNKIYGRGAIDDKGPVIASLYAMKLVMDNCKVNKRVRLILGLNEEKDWKCINYYKQHEEVPNFGFSPDADFPCIYAEKALLNVHLKSNYKPNDTIIIKEIDFNDNAMNVVPKFCKIKLSINENINIDNCINDLMKIVDNYKYSIEITKEDNNIIISSHGISSHSAHPDLGINAISHAIIVLNDFFEKHNINIELIKIFSHYIHEQYDGKNLNIDYSDESGNLTLNVARFYLENNTLGISMNLRIPVHTNTEEIENKFIKICNNTSITPYFDGKKDALFIPKDNKLINTLCSIFNNVTGKSLSPIAIGGATYARAFPNCVSFGANMPGNEDMCHKVDEFISIENLLLATKIYANAIYELCK